MMSSLRAAVRRLNSERLRALTKRLEAELIAEIEGGTVLSTMATIRRIEVMNACSLELYNRPLYGRSELELRRVSWFDAHYETVLGDPNTLQRFSNPIRVF